MISFQKSLTELDRAYSVERAALECYWSAIRSAEQYLVEVDPAETKATRAELCEVLAIAENSASPDQLLDTRGRLRASLRDYQDRTHSKIARLRADLQSAVAAMQSAADSIVAQEGDHRARLGREIAHLKVSATFADLNQIRTAVLASAHGIEVCVERLQCENQLAIAQLSDEIRSLHEQIEEAGKMVTLDPSTGLFNHEQIELRVEVAASSGITKSLCLIYIRVRNYKLLCHQLGRAAAETALAALSGRVRGIFGPKEQIGRWSDDELLILAQSDPVEALARSKRAAASTPGEYAIHVDGALRKITVQTQILFVERRNGETARDLLRRVDEFALVPQTPDR